MKADANTVAEVHPRRDPGAWTSTPAGKLRSSYENLSEVVARAETLDRPAEAPAQTEPEPVIVPARPNIFARALGALERWRQQAANRGLSSISRRIVLLNLAGLVALVSGILYLSEYRAGLVDARVQSLLIQGEIIAGAIAASATADTHSITIDPNRLLELRQGESYGPDEEILAPLDFPINPERVAPLLRRLVTPTDTRARIYDRDGRLLLELRARYTGAATFCDSTCRHRRHRSPDFSSANGIRSTSASREASFRSTGTSVPATAAATKRSAARSTD